MGLDQYALKFRELDKEDALRIYNDYKDTFFNGIILTEKEYKDAEPLYAELVENSCMRSITVDGEVYYVADEDEELAYWRKCYHLNEVIQDYLDEEVENTGYYFVSAEDWGNIEEDYYAYMNAKIKSAKTAEEKQELLDEKEYMDTRSFPNEDGFYYIWF